jgi:Fe-S cluster assembly protein SufD
MAGCRQTGRAGGAGSRAVPRAGGWLAAARTRGAGAADRHGPARAARRILALHRSGQPERPRGAAAALFDDSDEAPAFDGIDRVKLVFVDGVFDAKASDDPRLAGVEIERLAEAGGKDIHWAQGLYGVLEARGQVPVPARWRR